MPERLEEPCGPVVRGRCSQRLITQGLGRLPPGIHFLLGAQHVRHLTYPRHGLTTLHGQLRQSGHPASPPWQKHLRHGTALVIVCRAHLVQYCRRQDHGELPDMYSSPHLHHGMKNHPPVLWQLLVWLLRHGRRMLAPELDHRGCPLARTL